MAVQSHSRSDVVDIASLVGHELGTPIATALLYLGIAECHCSAESRSSFVLAALSVARSEVKRLKRLVDRVTELERCGRAVIRPQSVDLSAVVRATIERALVTESRMPETVKVETQGALVGWWDDSAVEQIVRNLLSNAIKFGEDREVRVIVEASPEGARIVVQDYGVGIRAADRGRIFERSIRSPVHRGGGLGLGLWLVRELVIAHGGRVDVQSRVGHGSTFSVVLPEMPPENHRPARAAPGLLTPGLPSRVTVQAGVSRKTPWPGRR
jgi:signal transduction histidine kinase